MASVTWDGEADSSGPWETSDLRETLIGEPILGNRCTSVINLSVDGFKMPLTWVDNGITLYKISL